MPHIDFEKAKNDVPLKLSKWTEKCKKHGGTGGHPTNHPATNKFGVGYPGASEGDPATILTADWESLKNWWMTEKHGASRFDRNQHSSGDGTAVLVCQCTMCDKITVHGKDEPPRFVYHLKVVKEAPKSDEKEKEKESTK